MGKKKLHLMLDEEKMKKAGKGICLQIEPYIRLRKDRLPASFSGSAIELAGYEGSMPIRVKFDTEMDDDDIVADFSEAIRCISRIDPPAGQFLLLKYVCGRTDDDIESDMSCSSRLLNKIKTNAYTMVAYIADQKSYIDPL